MQSIYFYSKNSFREYIKTITDKTKSVPEVLATFRELKVLPKEFETMTDKQLAHDDEKIMYLFTELTRST